MTKPHVSVAQVVLKVFRPALWLLIIVLAFAARSAAQVETAALSGTVTDPTGAVVAGAEVRATKIDTNTDYVATSNGSGLYLIVGLQPGKYRVFVTKQGFKQIVLTDVTLNVQDTVNRNFALELGATSETITVKGGAPMVQTQTGAVSMVIDQSYVKNMPLNGRSFQDLILLTPGIVTQTPQALFMAGSAGLGLIGEFSVNGQRPESNYYTVDGVSANVGASLGGVTFRAGPSGSLPASTALGTTQALVSVDALQEFRVQSSSYSAEYGRNPGGQFAFETKSGTNQWHGTAYDYVRNNYFDANDWFNNYFGVKGAGLRQNDFGGTLGGPVRIPGLYNGRDKTFFFISYEGLRLIAPQPAIATFVPDLCMQGMGPCPPGRNPAASALQPVVRGFPLPSSNGLEDATNGIGQFIGSWSNPSSLDATSVRLNHVVSDKLRLFFRFSDTSSSSATRGPFSGTPTFLETSDYVLRTFTVGADSILNNHLSNEFRLNYSSNEVTSRSDITPWGGSSPLNLSHLTGLGLDSESTVFFILGSSVLFISQGQFRGTQSQWNLVDGVTFSSGRHQMKFGVDFRRLTPSQLPPGFLAQYGFFSESDVESNSPFVFLQTAAPAYPLFRNFSTFAKDEWRVSQRLDLSLGLRWDVDPAPGAWKGLQAYALQGFGPDTWKAAPQGTPLWDTTWYNFAPRLGVAYLLRSAPGHETVVRGGGGVFFDTGQQLGIMAFDGLGFIAQVTPSIPFPGNPSALAPAIVNPPVGQFGAAVQVPARNLKLPYTIQWNASVEQALGQSQSLGIFYVGSHAARLLRLTEFQGSANSISSLFRIGQNGSTSYYGSLQIQFQRRLSRGLTALASDTWSHCLDYGSQNYTYGYQRGHCDFDVRHNLSAAFSYNLPNVGQNAFAKGLLGHWGIDDRFTARSAFPVTLDGNALLQPDGQLYHAGLNLVPGQPVYLYGSSCASVLQGLGDLQPGQACPGGRAINPLAFANVSSGLGNAPRNFTRGFGAWQMNLAVRREFPIHERLKLHFRAEAFNIFNHPNFGTIDPFFGDPTFGQATGTLANSLPVLNPLYQMGGPRSMQLALKLEF